METNISTLETDPPMTEIHNPITDTHNGSLTTDSDAMSNGNTGKKAMSTGIGLRNKPHSGWGRTRYSILYAATRVSDAVPVAIKTIPSCVIGRDPVNQQLPLEVSLMQSLSHVPGVVKLIEACWLADGDLLVIMERLECCMDLYE